MKETSAFTAVIPTTIYQKDKMPLLSSHEQARADALSGAAVAPNMSLLLNVSLCESAHNSQIKRLLSKIKTTTQHHWVLFDMGSNSDVMF